MRYSPGDSWLKTFDLYSLADGGSADADALPTGEVWRNAVLDPAVSVTVTRKAEGLYKAAATIPSDYEIGDRFEVRITATMGGITAADAIESTRLEATGRNVQVKITEMRAQ